MNVLFIDVALPLSDFAIFIFAKFFTLPTMPASDSRSRATPETDHDVESFFATLIRNAEASEEATYPSDFGFYENVYEPIQKVLGKIRNGHRTDYISQIHTCDHTYFKC
jgi:hypothetical protein